MHFGSPTDSWDPCGKAKPSHVQYILGEVKPICIPILELTSVFHHLPIVGPKQLNGLAHLGCTHEANVHRMIQILTNIQPLLKAL